MTETDNEKKESKTDSQDANEHVEHLKNTLRRKVTAKTFLQTCSAVFWAFFGVRRLKNHDDDINNLNPVHVILVGILAAVIFVVGLLVIVSLVVANS